MSYSASAANVGSWCQCEQWCAIAVTWQHVEVTGVSLVQYGTI